MVSQAPVIPVLEEVDWFQFNPTHIGNFPSSTNPYAQPGLYNQPDWGYVLWTTWSAKALIGSRAESGR